MTKTWYAGIPKTQLHVHLEGATSFETFLALADKNRVILPFTSAENAKHLFGNADLESFLWLFRQCTDTIKRVEDFGVLLEQFAKHLAQQNIKYCEFFVSLSSYMIRGFCATEILDAITGACHQFGQQYGVLLRCIPDISRERSVALAELCTEYVINHKNDIIIGLGLGGSERNGCRKFAHCFRVAKNAGLHTVAHAGEMYDSSIIWEAIMDLGVERIGHGVASVTDENLMAYLRERQIPLEVCPTSNYYTGFLAPNEVHPIRNMIDAGLYVTINSDDPVMFNTDLTEELYRMQQMGFSKGELFKLLCRNIRASFMTDDQKHSFLKELVTYCKDELTEPCPRY